MQVNLLVILGPTATGKTRIGVQVARTLGGEIISADSRQVFRGMNIGTGKDLAEYGEVPYHLIDIKEPGGEFSVFDFQRSFIEAFKKISFCGKLPVLVGGTGLYLESVLEGYRLSEVPENTELRGELNNLSNLELIEKVKKIRPALHNTTDLIDRRRLIRAIEIVEHSEKNLPPADFLADLSPVVFGIKWEREDLRQRITRRLKERLNGGMVDEVRNLRKNGLSFEKLEDYGLEYRYVSYYLKGELNWNDMFQKLNSAIHQFARRQETWFRRMERKGIKIRWVDGQKQPVATIVKIFQNISASP